MFNVRPIRTEADYEAALSKIDELLGFDEGTTEDDDLQVLSTLVEAYEDEHYPIDFPDPVAAIKFRMEQDGLTKKDLIPLLGSASRVSEVLSRKRPLTLAMIRALHSHLGIPAEVLIREPGAILPAAENFEWDKFPLRELASRKWVKTGKSMRALKDRAEEIMRPLFERAGGFDAIPLALCHKNDSAYHNAKMDSYALLAWCLHVLGEARSHRPSKKFVNGSVTPKFLKEVAALSARSDGVRSVTGFLAERGISLIVAPHLPKTYLDGVAMMTKDGLPVVGLSLRYDRIDNFWFCLLHELAHIGRHLSKDPSLVFVDDLDLQQSKGNSLSEAVENEANEWAEQSLIPAEVWESHPVRDNPTPFLVAQLASELQISPAIVAGRVRRESRNFHLLSQLVGNGEVRRHFPQWREP